jgi:hypothetical protein
MLFKIILVVLVIAMLASLSGALRALLLNQKSDDGDNTLKWLTIRVCIAVAIIVVIFIGFFTGQLSIGAPWSGQY